MTKFTEIPQNSPKSSKFTKILKITKFAKITKFTEILKITNITKFAKVTKITKFAEITKFTIGHKIHLKSPDKLALGKPARLSRIMIILATDF